MTPAGNNGRRGQSRTGATGAIVSSARRLVVKIGSSSLTTAARRAGPGPRRRARRCPGRTRRAGREVVLVSSGAIAAGLAPLGLKARPRDLATQQAAASVGQGLLMRAYTESFGRHGRTVGQVLLTVDDVTRRAHYRNAYRTLRRLLDLRAIPIVNENDTVATDEIRFGDNDRHRRARGGARTCGSAGASLRCGRPLHRRPRPTGCPTRRRDQGRRRPRRRGHRSDRPRRRRDGRDGDEGRGGPHRHRCGNPGGVDVRRSAAEALAGEPVGTLFHRVRERPAARLFWLAHATAPRGRLHLDEGAVRAVVSPARLAAAGRHHRRRRSVHRRRSG